MTVENASNFLVKASEDTEIATQLEQINTVEELIEYAHQQGYEFSEVDLQEVRAIVETDELSEDQLEAVAGGQTIPDSRLDTINRERLREATRPIIRFLKRRFSSFF